MSISSRPRGITTGRQPRIVTILCAALVVGVTNDVSVADESGIFPISRCMSLSAAMPPTDSAHFDETATDGHRT